MQKLLILLIILFLLTIILFSGYIKQKRLENVGMKPTTTTTTIISCPPASCQNLMYELNTAYGSDCNSNNYNPVADVNKDKKINLKDLMIVTDYCGSNGSWCQSKLNDLTNPCIGTTSTVSTTTTI